MRLAKQFRGDLLLSVAAVTTTLIAAGILLVWDRAHPTLQEQTSFLERVAGRVERAKSITPETHDVLSGVLQRTRNRPARDGIKSEVEQHWQSSILRLERALWEKKTTAQTVIGN
ncbi:MAG: hypothetical protein ACM3OF_09835 [Gemmatimonas sp.]